MKTLLVLCLLCSLTLQQVVLLASNTTNTVIISQPNLAVGANPHSNAKIPNFLGTGAQWIWQSGGSLWPHGQTLTFQTQFFIDCNGRAILSITADDTFSAVLNGNGAPMTGNDWSRKYEFPLSPLHCGINILVITAVNYNDNSVAALIFSVTQDQSSCYNCLTKLAFFNRKTCQCECNQGCECQKVNKNYVWHDYPTCGCSCSRNLICRGKRYFVQDSCSCQCKPIYCAPGYTQSPRSCKCIPVPKLCPAHVKSPSCPPGQYWSQQECDCLCAHIKVCKFPFLWDDESCQCSTYSYA